jgi:hypothetical protein
MNTALDFGQSFFFVFLFFCTRAWEESLGSSNLGLDVNRAIVSGWNLEGTYCAFGRFPIGTSLYWCSNKEKVTILAHQ